MEAADKKVSGDVSIMTVECLCCDAVYHSVLFATCEIPNRFPHIFDAGFSSYTT